MLRNVTVTHLEMLSPESLKSKPKPSDDVDFVAVNVAMPELNRFFYSAVGGDWHWHERLVWSYSKWLSYLNRPELQTWLITVKGVPAGYCELELQSRTDVEIVYFGLLAAFTGSGIGGWALSEAVRKAWEMNPSRVWVHTCNLDHPGALSNYLARGFKVFKTETFEEDLPEQPSGPWPGSGKFEAS